MSEWKPGDLITGDDGGAFFIVEVTGNTRAAARMGRAWQPGSSAVDADGNGWRADTIEGARPLVVIDPESDEDVERVRDALWLGGRLAAWQDGLRSLTKPPKPPEPQGLGAVVEDANGVLWTRVESGAGVTRNPWYPANLAELQPDEYSDIAAVKVLSDGVTS